MLFFSNSVHEKKLKRKHTHSQPWTSDCRPNIFFFFFLFSLSLSSFFFSMDIAKSLFFFLNIKSIKIIIKIPIVFIHCRSAYIVHVLTKPSRSELKDRLQIRSNLCEHRTEHTPEYISDRTCKFPQTIGKGYNERRTKS